MKNPMGKTRRVDKGEKPYVVFEDYGWRTEVLKTYQLNGMKQYARALCRVITPMTGPRGDLGDTYITSIPGNVVEFDEDVFPSAVIAEHAVRGYAAFTFRDLADRMDG